jgi:hypothetical protein
MEKNIEAVQGLNTEEKAAHTHTHMEIPDRDADGNITVKKAQEVFGAYSQLKSITKVKEDLTDSISKVTGDSDVSDKLHDLVSAMTPDEIKALDDAAVDAIYTTDEGSFDLAGVDSVEMRRDFLVYLRETRIAEDQIDAEMKKLEEYMVESRGELDELIAEYGDLSTFMYQELVKRYEEADGIVKENLGRLVEAYDQSYTLENVVATLNQFGTKNIIGDFKHRGTDLYKKYKANMKKINIQADIADFAGMEVRHLEEKYHPYVDLFAFTIIRIYAYKKELTPADGVFVSQLAVNLKSLYSDTFGSEEKKEQFLSSIRKVLDLIIGE